MKTKNQKQKHLKILNWNCRGFIDKRAEIQHLSEQYDIISLSETFLKEKHTNTSINNFNHIRNDRPTHTYGGGLIVFVKQDIQYTRFYLQNCPLGLEYIALEIYKGSECLSLVSIYYPPNMDIDKTTLSRFFDEVEDKGDLIISGDFNCQSAKWGSDIVNDRGIRLEEILDNIFSMKILNTGSATRFYKNSVPDISISSASIEHKIIWKTLEEPMGSDHFPIQILFKDFNLRLSNERPKIHLSRVDWENFSQSLDAKVEDFPEVDSTNYLLQYSKSIDFMYDSLTESNAKLPSPDHPIYKAPPATVWWDTNCSQLVDARRSAMSECKKNFNRETFSGYTKAKKEAKKITMIKTLNFRAHAQTLNPHAPIERTESFFRKYERRFIEENPHSQDKNSVQSNAELQGAFQKINTSIQSKDNFSLDYEYDQNHFLSRELTLTEIQSAILKAKTKSAPGQDMITYTVIKAFAKSTLNWLTKFFNLVITHGNTPLQWKQISIIFIDKPGKKGYRPIALASCVQKILERVINDRMMWWYESKGLIPKNFFGFRRSKSCADCLAALQLDIRNATKRGCFLGVIFLDIMGTYNSVNLEKLIQILIRQKIPPQIVKFVINIVQDRTLTAYYNNVQFGLGSTNKGLPQGSIISPLLFNIYLAEIVHQVDENIKIISFADDVCIQASHENIDILKEHLASNLIQIEKWLLTMNLRVAFNKTHLMLFGPHSQTVLPDTHTIKINSEISLPNCARVRYLGVVWDYKLDWSEHILNTRNNARRLLSMLSSVAGFDWGAQPESLLTVFKTLIRPKMDWGCFLFANAKKNKPYNA